MSLVVVFVFLNLHGVLLRVASAFVKGLQSRRLTKTAKFLGNVLSDGGRRNNRIGERVITLREFVVLTRSLLAFLRFLNRALALATSGLETGFLLILLCLLSRLLRFLTRGIANRVNVLLRVRLRLLRVLRFLLYCVRLLTLLRLRRVRHLPCPFASRLAFSAWTLQLTY